MLTNGDVGRIKNNYFDGLKVTRKQLLLFVIVAAAYFFDVFDQAIFSFTAPAIMASMKLTAANVASLTSIYFLGNTFGGIFGGIISDIIGRRKTMLFSIFVFTLGSVLNGVTNNFAFFMAARCLTGFGLMCMLVVTITYMAELSPKESRGRWEALISGFGSLAGPLIGFVCAYVVPLSSEAWRYIFWSSGIGFVFLIIAGFLLKESPRWLMSRGRQAEAEEVVSSLTGVPIDLSDVVVASGKRMKTSKVIAEMFSPLYLKRTIILLVVLSAGVVSLQITQPWTATLLKMSGFSMKDSILLTTLFTFGIPLGQFVAAYFSDKGGRRLAIAAFAILYCFVTLPFILLIHGSFYVVAIFGLLFNLTATARNFIIHPYVAESLPTRLRNSVTGFLNAASRFVASGAQLIVPMVFAGYGIAGVFGLGMAISALAGVVVLLFGWRSAHISLEDINEKLIIGTDSRAHSDKINA